ncbi:hypothetical protein [Streptomyces mirabilis]|uniref:hypothetical protein n=1 Tax=Streptomyces mirabilis TaxID=68239 RepID=UPI00332F29D8
MGRLPRSCNAGQLPLADREFLGVPLWRAFTVTGADVLWWVPANRILPVDRMLRDGSWISRIHAHTDPAPSARSVRDADHLAFSPVEANVSEPVRVADSRRIIKECSPSKKGRNGANSLAAEVPAPVPLVTLVPTPSRHRPPLSLPDPRAPRSSGSRTTTALLQLQLQLQLTLRDTVVTAVV